MAGFESYAEQVASIYKDKPGVLEDVLDALFHIAKADNEIKGASESMINVLVSVEAICPILSTTVML